MAMFDATLGMFSSRFSLVNSLLKLQNKYISERGKNTIFLGDRIYSANEHHMFCTKPNPDSQ